MRKMWFALHNLFNEKELDELENIIKNMPTHSGVIGKEGAFSKDLEIRRSNILFLERQNYPVLFDKLSQIIIEANSEAFGVNVDKDLVVIQLAEYNSSEAGKYDWHSDLDWFSNRPFSERKLTLVMQLTDPLKYEGGSLEFEKYKWSPEELIKRKERGSIIIFPSFVSHRVTEVTKGVRRSLVVWMEGPKFR